MKKLKFLVIAIAAVISTLLVQNVYAADEYSISYTVDTPLEGATMPTKVNATIKLEGEPQGTQELNLFWYEVQGYTYKKVDYTKFKAGKTYRPSVVDINFTTVTHGQPGSAYSNCAIIGKGTNVETGPSHLSNAFRCDYSLVEVINDESDKVFSIPMKKVKEVNIVINTEIAGTTAEKGESYECSKYNDLTGEWENDTCYKMATYPTVKIEGNAEIGDGGQAFYITSFPSESESFDAPFFGTFVEGKEYYVETYIVPEDGYEFDENTVIKVNGKTTGFEEGEWSTPLGIIIYSKIVATTKAPEKAEYKVLDGNNQEVTQASDIVKFRFNIDYSKFLASGKVFVDGNLTDSKNYDSAEGSTIITLKKEFTSTLAAGKHTVTVAVDDGEVSGTFIIAESVPKTLDNIEWSVAVCVLSVTALIGTAIYTKKKSFN